jgi:undecaprenyl-diphosphatase
MHPLLTLARRWNKLAVAAAVLGLVGLGFFANIIEDVVTGDSAAGDRLLLRRAHRLAVSPDGDWMTPLARALSLLGNWQALIPLGLVLMFLAWRGVVSWRPWIFYAIACAGCAALTLGFKFLIGRPRPQIVPALEEVPFKSFPSGHALFALVAYGFVAYLVARSPHCPVWLKYVITAAALLLALLIGGSRVYLGTHYPTDVAAGYLIGVPWLVTVILAFEYGRLGGRGVPSAP